MAGRLSRRGLALAGLALPGLARAQGNWPERPIRWIVPYNPAGTADILARLVADHLAERLGQPVSVENRAGAGGTRGATFVAQARGDLYMVTTSNFGSHAVSPSLLPSVAYDPLADFTHVGLLGALPQVVAANLDFPATDMAGFLAVARARGQDLGMGYGSVGAASHLIGLSLHRAAGITPNFVGFGGSGNLLNAVMGGTVPTMIDTLSAGIGHIRAGRIKAFAISGPERSPALPEAPTFAELGLGEATAMNWFGLALPAGVPDWLRDRWAAALREVMALPAVRERLASLGAEGTRIDPSFMTEHVRSEAARWRRVIAENNIRPG